MYHHTTVRKCPRCGGAFKLDFGTAHCPHCGKCVVATDTAAPAIDPPPTYWEQEIGAMLAEFGGTKLEVSIRKLAAQKGIVLDERREP